MMENKYQLSNDFDSRYQQLHESDSEFSLNVDVEPIEFYSGRNVAPLFVVLKRGFLRSKMGKVLLGFERPIIAMDGKLTENSIAMLHPLFSKQQIVFLGDFDPPSLFCFAHLRSKLRREIHYGFFNDSFLEKISENVRKSTEIQLSKHEMLSVDYLFDVIPDLEDLVGKKSCKILRSGRKYELEMVLSCPNIFKSSINEVLENLT